MVRPMQKYNCFTFWQIFLLVFKTNIHEYDAIFAVANRKYKHFQGSKAWFVECGIHNLIDSAQDNWNRFLHPWKRKSQL